MFKEKIRIQLLGGSLTDHGSYTDGNYQDIRLSLQQSRRFIMFVSMLSPHRIPTTHNWRSIWNTRSKMSNIW